MREARIHVRHVRDILKSLEMADAYNGVDCNSLSFLNVVTQGDILGMMVMVQYATNILICGPICDLHHKYNIYKN